MVKKCKIGVIKGDGVGPEIIDAALNVLTHLDLNAEIVEFEAGYEFYKRTGKTIDEDFFQKVKELDAVLKGPLYTPPQDPSFRSINVMIRRKLDLYANIRPFRSFRGISQKHFNLVIFRENTEGEYMGIEGMINDLAVTLRVVSRPGSERICRLAFNYAKTLGFKRVTLVHKANILKLGDGLFRKVFFDIAKEFPDIESDEVVVDTAAYLLVKSPEKFQILVTPNLYGDILSDVASGMVGSIGLCGSALIGNKIGVFEPIHGVAMDIAGKGIANPVGAIMALKMMLEYMGQKNGDVQLLKKALGLEKAVYIVIEERKIWTPDLGGQYKTVDVVKTIIEEIKNITYYL